MKVDTHYGWVHITIGMEFQMGPGRWRLEEILTAEKILSTGTQATTVPICIARLIDGTIPDSDYFRDKLRPDGTARIAGDTIGMLIFERNRAEKYKARLAVPIIDSMTLEEQPLDNSDSNDDNEEVNDG